jgi:hypothetical protein
MHAPAPTLVHAHAHAHAMSRHIYTHTQTDTRTCTCICTRARACAFICSRFAHVCLSVYHSVGLFLLWSASSRRCASFVFSMSSNFVFISLICTCVIQPCKGAGVDLVTGFRRLGRVFHVCQIGFQFEFGMGSRWTDILTLAKMDHAALQRRENGRRYKCVRRLGRVLIDAKWKGSFLV